MRNKRFLSLAACLIALLLLLSACKTGVVTPTAAPTQHTGTTQPTGTTPRTQTKTGQATATTTGTEQTSAGTTDITASRVQTVATKTSTETSSESKQTTPPAGTVTQPVTQPPTEPAPQGVTISVDCHKAVDNGMRDWPGYDKIVPADGTILLLEDYAFAQGESALDILKRAAKENGVVVKERGGYISAINGLAEKVCENKNGGWLYLVNGERPSYSSAQYIPKAGDTIVFAYTCKPGDFTQ